jgi:mannose/cellobiose epimerase-like protein (N-acyl-D-glucosamine 2-epimerase family)
VGETLHCGRSARLAGALIEYGWDQEYGGIFYRRDALDKPPLQIEWERKMWWAHAEALVALAKGHTLTGDRRCGEWCERVFAYICGKFADPVRANGSANWIGAGKSCSISRADVGKAAFTCQGHCCGRRALWVNAQYNNAVVAPAVFIQVHGKAPQIARYKTIRGMP